MINLTATPKSKPDTQDLENSKEILITKYLVHAYGIFLLPFIIYLCES